MDFYGTLQTILNPNSVYSKDIDSEIENYIKVIVEELKFYFKPE